MVSGSLGYRKCPKTVTIRSTATKVMYRKKSEGKKLIATYAHDKQSDRNAASAASS